MHRTRSNSPERGPVVSFREENAGPKTLAAIAEARADAFQPRAYRAPTRTKHYGDRISNAPGAVSPSSARALDDAPEISVAPHRPGQRTFELIENEDRNDTPEISVEPYRPGLKTYALIEEDERTRGPDLEVSCRPSHTPLDGAPNLYALEIEQIHTFSVRCCAAYFQTDKDKKRLVDGRLLAKMPGVTLEDVVRVEVEAQGDTLMLVRVFSRVPA